MIGQDKQVSAGRSIEQLENKILPISLTESGGAGEDVVELWVGGANAGV